MQNRFLLSSLVLILFLTSSTISQAQEATFTDIYNIFQTKCTGCHGGASPQGNLDLSGTLTEVYDVLVDATPTNPAAVAKGYAQVMPGYPKRSYLLNKIATAEWDHSYVLEQAEGNIMPPNELAKLANKDIELVRQWILFGAPMNKTVVDPQLLVDYYDNGMGIPTTEPIDPPAEGEGFQLEFGPIFLAPLEEKEFYKKHDINLSENYEVNAIDIAFNAESHHFILYKMEPQIANTHPEGLRNVEDTEQSIIENTLIAPWQNAHPFDLPEGTAYRIKSTDIYDLNYHLKNYSTGVLAGKVYINVYTQAMGTAEKEMHSQLYPVSLFDMFFGQPIGSGLVIPNDGAEHTFTEHLWIPDFPNIPFPTGVWNLWQLSTHTHARGVDYDVYISEDGQGTKGEQIFEGFYNSNYTFNQGFYDWEHPPVRVFDPLLPVDMSMGHGLVHEAKFINDGDEVLRWGNSVDDEMMLIFAHYTIGETTAVSELDTPDAFDITVFPNPVSSNVQVVYDVATTSKVDITFYNLQGVQVIQQDMGILGAGKHSHYFNVAQLPSGVYYVKCAIDGQAVVRQLVVE